MPLFRSLALLALLSAGPVSGDELKTPLSRVQVEFPEAPFRGAVLAAGAPTVQKRPNGVVTVGIPLGTSRPITCLFYPNPIDAGATARTLINTFQARIKFERVRATDVKTLARSPALYLEGEVSQGGKVGRILMMVHADPALPKACYHEEQGLPRTFLDVTASLATGLTSTAADKPVAPVFREVQVLREGEQVLGFQSTAVFGARSGGTVLERTTTRVRPGPPSELQFEDLNVQAHADTSGLLVRESYEERRGDTVVGRLVLTREQDGSSQVQGQWAGKDVQARMKGSVVGDVGLAQRLRDTLIQRGKPVEVVMWEPAAHPTSSTKVVARRRAGKGPRAATLKVGTGSLNVELDAHGFVSRAEGPAPRVTRERLSETDAP